MNTKDDTASEPLETTCPPQAVISRDLRCVGCEYNLRTMQVGGRCSECGLAVERSLLVLPRPRETAKAIKLAAYALVVGFVGVFVPLFKMLALAMLLFAAHRLQHRCALSHMSELGPKVRWFWITIVISAPVLMLSVADEWTRGEFRLLTSTSIGSRLIVSTKQSFGRRVTVLRYSEVAGRIEVATDAQGRREVALLDDSGNVVSTSTLAPGQSASVRDAAGHNVRLNLDAAGMLTIQPRASRRVQVSPNGTTLVTNRPPGVLGMLLVAVVVVIAPAAMILYILVCRALAIRSAQPRLARRFTIILWLIVSAVAVMVAVVVGGILVLGSKGVGLSWPVPALAALCLLVAAVSQIVASFQLSSALRHVPRHWSEVAAVPGAE